MFEDALKDSWAYQEILQEGLQEGLQIGEQRGLQIGEQRGLQIGEQRGLQKGLQEELHRQRQALEYLVRKKSPNMIEMAKERGNAIDRPDVLQDMIFQLFNAETEEEVRQILSR